MGIGVARRYVGLVQLQGRILQLRGHRAMLSKLRQQVGHRVAPRLGPQALKDGFHRLFCRLLGREGCPVVEAPLQVALGMQQIALGLVQPVAAPVHELYYSWQPAPGRVWTSSTAGGRAQGQSCPRLPGLPTAVHGPPVVPAPSPTWLVLVTDDLGSYLLLARELGL